MKTVRQLLESKGRQIYSIEPTATVFEAIRRMAEHSVGALLVMENEHLVGIISERDYARKVILQGRASKETPVSEVMTPKVYCASESQTVQECMAIMSQKRIRHLPVLAADRVSGVISQGDLVKSRLEEQEFLIEQLESYICG